MITSRRVLATCLGLALPLVASCGDDSSSSAGADRSPAPEASSSAHGQAQALAVDEAWVKAAPDGMSAAFGVLRNEGDAPLRVTGAASPAAATVELHETVDDGSGQMVMRERDGGFEIPAGGELHLQPGGDHLMLMGLVGPIQAGDDVQFTLTAPDGSTFSFTAPAKDYSGANEHYEHH